MKHMAWGAARQLFNSAPPVVAIRKIQHNFQLAASAVRSGREGDWGQAFSTLLEMPEKTALGAARVLTAPIDAALSIPASVQAAMNPEADPEMRGAAMVQGAQAVLALVAAVVGAAAAVKSASDGAKAGPKLGEAGGEGAGKGFSSKIKEQARAESNNSCVFCGKKTTTRAGPSKSEIDHAIPKSRGGNNTIDNAQNTCRTCNRQRAPRRPESSSRRGEAVFDLEVGEDAKRSRCACCGAESCTGHGFVYKNGFAYAIYYVGWSPGHPDRGVSMAIAVGRWDDSSSASDRVCFGLEAYEGESSVLFRFIDPAQSPWPETELLGKMISRVEALRLGTDLAVLSVAEHVVRSHPSIRGFLHVSP